MLIDGAQITTDAYRSNDTLQVEVPTEPSSIDKRYDIFYGDISAQENTLSISYTDERTATYSNRVELKEDAEDEDKVTGYKYTKSWSSDADVSANCR